MNRNTTTLTFGDVAENHKGMQKMGNLASTGFTLADLEKAKEYFESRGIACELIQLNKDRETVLPDAYILIARGGVNALVNIDDLSNEQRVLRKDTKAFMYGRVVDKKARHNLCFSDFDQDPDYENGKGTVVDFKHLPMLSKLRAVWGDVIGKADLQCEGNYYYDVKKTYIGFHGDTERRIVIGVRLGESFPLHFMWFKNSKPVGSLFTTMLNNGDVYFMSDKATGYDWHRKVIYTLRHAAGDVKHVMKWKPSDVQKL